MEKTGDFYDLLGVHKQASVEEIRARYHHLARLYHPDRAKEKDKDLAHRLFVRINQAYSTLINPESRERYDQRSVAKKAASNTNGANRSAPQEPPPSPDEIRQWMGQANEAFLKGDIGAAHEYCRKLIRGGRAPIEAYILIGDIYVGEHQKEKALTAYRVALKLQPDNKMLQAKVHRLEVVLGKPTTTSRASEESAARVDASAVKRSLFSRLADMRAKKLS
ncbi:MAG TPA: DnaJ domain-containing protein, partial [Capsulimonadaceae bacterium]|nr:DnaJ domain-containing protein [Capsulimonadaceae bacterium]